MEYCGTWSALALYKYTGKVHLQANASADVNRRHMCGNASAAEKINNQVVVTLGGCQSLTTS